MRMEWNRERWELVPAGERQTALRLLDCNDWLGRHGLRLSEETALAVARGRVEALRNTGRVEFGAGVADRLLTAFCDSPYLTRQNLEETLIELQESFYYFKGEALERLSDDELIERMRRYFDTVAQGSLDYLSGTSLEELCRDLRFDGSDDERML